MTKPRIWHLVSNRWNSAIAEYALQASRSLFEAGYPTLVSPLATKPLEKRARQAGLPLESVDNFKPGFPTLQRLRSIRKAFQPDLYMVYGGQETFISRLLAGKQPVVRFRGQNEDLQLRASRLAQLGQRHITALLAPSQIVANHLASSFHKPIYVVPLGCDLERFYHKPAAYKALQRPTLQILGRLDPVKGHKEFFGIFRELLRIWPAGAEKPILQVIGEPANISSGAIREEASSQQLVEGRDWLLVDRRVPNLAETMSAAHVAVISSTGSEVICRVAEEYLLCGTPLFVSGVGSLEECLISPQAGRSYRSYTVTDAAKLLYQLLKAALEESSQLREERSALAAKHFSRQGMAEGLTQVIDTVLAAGTKA